MNIATIMKNFAVLGLLSLAAPVVGCNGTAEDHQSPARAAKEALNIKGSERSEKTVETQRDVDVIRQTTVVDRKTGEVIKTEKEVTPVTVKKTKEVQTDLQPGKTTKSGE
jgi:hypothetical protein